MTYDDLGPYKYLLRMSLEGDVRDSHRDAVARLAEYDRQRSTSLLHTLEEFLRRRGNISATAEALYVHPNTLRQRLRLPHDGRKAEAAYNEGPSMQVAQTSSAICGFLPSTGGAGCWKVLSIRTKALYKALYATTPGRAIRRATAEEVEMRQGERA